MAGQLELRASAGRRGRPHSAFRLVVAASPSGGGEFAGAQPRDGASFSGAAAGGAAVARGGSNPPSQSSPAPSVTPSAPVPHARDALPALLPGEMLLRAGDSTPHSPRGLPEAEVKDLENLLADSPLKAQRGISRMTGPAGAAR